MQNDYLMSSAKSVDTSQMTDSEKSSLPEARAGAIGGQAASESSTLAGKPPGAAAHEVRPMTRFSCRWLVVLLGCLAGAMPARGDAPPACAAEPLPPVLSRDAAVQWALLHNPELIALRQQHGIAAAGVVIARTFPYNPLLESRVQNASGPNEAGITNRTPTEQLLFFTLELWGQGRIRPQVARATLSRTDWEIAYQEQLLGVRVLRAFRGLLYRQEKLKLSQDFVRLNEDAARQVQAAVELGTLRPADLILVRTEVDNARAAVGPARAALTTARTELLRALGAPDGPLVLEGELEVISGKGDPQALVQAAFDTRADLQARHAAVEEATARLRLEVANRFGNPTFGPAYVYDPTGIQLIGAQLNLPVPLFNRHRGEILQREAERTRAILEVQRTEVQIHQDVVTALARLEQAQKWTNEYIKEILPDLQRSLEGMEKLFAQNAPNADLLRVILTRRNLLRARDGFLDALWEVSQARADLAAALGELDIGVAPCGPVPAAGPALTAPPPPARP
jgi:cobalt-zinc-cadmium efflux system outer membrane protein